MIDKDKIDSLTKSREDKLAILIADADKEKLPNVRAVLHAIKVEQTKENNIKAISTKKSKDLKETLEYLGGTEQEGLAAEAATLVCKGLAEKIMRRVENLLPEDCATCKKEYCYKRQEAPELWCHKCTKGACPDCYEQDKITINNLKMKNGGIFYLCLTCNVEIKKLNEINIEGRKAKGKMKAKKMKTKKILKPRKVPGKRKKQTTRLKILVSSQKDLKVTLMLKRCLRRLARKRSRKKKPKKRGKKSKKKRLNKRKAYVDIS